MFHTLDVLTKALDASMLRYNHLTNNIANVDTVGYKRIDVEFGNVLETQIRNNKGTSGVNPNNLTPIVYYDAADTAMRYDGNNVDIDREMSELSQEKTRYDVLIQRAQAQATKYQNIFQTLQ
ncbi:MAG: flagellar basal-body rod protein FlgB [Epulopiscium sp. Nuni2H_MBin003]|nr:MAG: flagellar basal-body rod protein FlgB [Epulopiscium sp. Nuni2H_MBin003]